VVWLGPDRRRSAEVDVVLGRLRLSEIVGARLVSENGTPAGGRVFDVCVRNRGDAFAGPWAVHSLLHGTQALRDRLRARNGGGRRTEIPWERVRDVSDGAIVVEGLADLVAI
jgi:hypothetical protein